MELKVVLKLSKKNWSYHFTRILFMKSSHLCDTLKKYTPLKKIYVRANQVPFINKTITKEIMKRSRLSCKFLNTKSEIYKAYNKQRNCCVTLIKNAKQTFLGDINPLSANPTKWSNTLKQFVGNLFECA